MHLVTMTGLTKAYRVGATVVHALRGIDLTIDQGEFTAIWGPSGSGKTTLLNLIGTLDLPSSGQLTVAGQEIMQLPERARTALRQRSIGFIFQRFNLIPVLSALENVMLPLQLRGMASAPARALALQRLEEVGLAACGQQRPDTLSGGQQQRVAIARALVTAPSLIIADEPTANLDSATAHDIIALMRACNVTHRTTFVFSTHDPRLLEHVTRQVRLADGRLHDTRSIPCGPGFPSPSATS